VFSVHKRSIIDLLQNSIRIYKFAAASRGSPAIARLCCQ